jgi:methionyl-tRNA formyltransferase
MMALGAFTLKETVDLIADGKAEAVAQEMLQDSGEEVCHAPKIFKEDCKIDWSKSGAEIHNFIRGLSPYPTAWTMLGDKSLKIFLGNFIQGNPQTPGEYVTDQKSVLKFACADGWYAIKELQFEGKKRMGVEEFLRGWRP